MYLFYPDRKNIDMKLTLRQKATSIFYILLGSLLSIGCNPENVVARNLEGTWKVTVYLVDSANLMDNGIESFNFDFGKYQKTEGDFSAELTYQDGRMATFVGEYELLNEGEAVEMRVEFQAQEDIWRFEVDLRDQHLDLVGSGLGHDELTIKLEGPQ